MASRPPPALPPPSDTKRPVTCTVPAGEQSLVHVVHLIYALLGGYYSQLTFTHIADCHNDSNDFNAELWDWVPARLTLCSFGEVETALQDGLLTLGCALACCFDRISTMGFYTCFHTPEDFSQEYPPLTMFVPPS